MQNYLDKATRLWTFGLLLDAMERYKEARKIFGNAMEDFRTALRSVDKLELRKVHNGGLGEMADLLIEDKGGFAPLCWAAAEGHEAVVRLLVDAGAAVDAIDREGVTPLLCAAAEGHEAVVKLLESHVLKRS